MADARRSQARQPLCQKNLDLVPNPHAAPKGCRKRSCEEDSSASMSQSRLIMQFNIRTNTVTTKQVQAGIKAPEPKKLCIREKNDTLKESAPTAISGSTSDIEVISDDKSEDSSEWLKKFLHTELDTFHTIKSGPELVDEFAPVDFESLLSCGAPRAEEALASLNKPPSSQQNLSRPVPTAEAPVTLRHRQSSSNQSSTVPAELEVPALPEIRQTRSYRKPPPTAPEVKAPPPCEVLNDNSRIRSNCNCSQKQLEMLRQLKEEFAAFAQQQIKCIDILTTALLRKHKDERGNHNPGPDTHNVNITVAQNPILAALLQRPL